VAQCVVLLTVTVTTVNYNSLTLKVRKDKKKLITSMKNEKRLHCLYLPF